MPVTENVVQLAERHMRESETRVRRQQEIVEHLRQEKLPTDVAETLLDNFRCILVEQQAHLDMIRREAARGAQGSHS